MDMMFWGESGGQPVTGECTGRTQSRVITRVVCLGVSLMYRDMTTQSLVSKHVQGLIQGNYVLMLVHLEHHIHGSFQ